MSILARWKRGTLRGLTLVSSRMGRELPGRGASRTWRLRRDDEPATRDQARSRWRAGGLAGHRTGVGRDRPHRPATPAARQRDNAPGTGLRAARAAWHDRTAQRLARQGGAGQFLGYLV